MKKISFLIIFLVTLFSCEENSNSINFQNESVVIDQNLYNQTFTNNYTITDVVLNDNLLTIKISSSGCSNNSWKAILIDANLVLESYPVQRNIKLALENNEACLAVFEQEFTFDISELKENFTEVHLNLEGWNSKIIYK